MSTQKFTKVTHQIIDGLATIEPTLFSDERGFFFESYNFDNYCNIGLDTIFVQDNQSRSYKNVLRGLHIQLDPPQDKLLRVLHGKIFDVVVDLRKDSPTFLNKFCIELSSDNNIQIMVPSGCAHGFLVLSEYADVFYRVSNYWNPKTEYGILWNDPILNVSWPFVDGSNIILSSKDKDNLNLVDFLKILDMLGEKQL